jgi:polygalacturonase
VRPIPLQNRKYLLDTRDSFLSGRREWLGRLPSTAALLSGAAGLTAAGEANAQSARPSVAKNELGAGVYNVRDFGATGGGKTLDTAAIQAAIDACYRDGGGTVLLPAGVFHTGTLELKSNVTFHIAAGGKLLGSADGKQYHALDAIPLHGDSNLEDGNWALLFAVDARNVTIEGPGTIDGQGFQFHSKVPGAPPPSGLGGNRRPYHLLFYRCENLAVRHTSLVESAYHSIPLIQSQRVRMDGIYIHNCVNGNNDGFHFITCKHVSVSNCVIESQDDACALFGSCQFVTVSNSSFSTPWSAFRFGGGIAQNISVSNCVLYQVYGCPIKFHGSPGSRFENISFSDLVLKDVTGPIHISAGPSPRSNTESSRTRQAEAQIRRLCGTSPSAISTRRSPRIRRNFPMCPSSQGIAPVKGTPASP